MDPTGAIAALDRNALFQLGFKSSAELVGAPLERIFNISLPALRRPQSEEVVPPVGDLRDPPWRPLLAVAQAPQSKRTPASKQPAEPLEEHSMPEAGRSVLDELDLGDPVLARNIQAAKRLESRDIPILLLGESGTGKEFFARALHSASERADKPFVAVNCGSLPETLMQNELFGRAGGVSITTEDERGRVVQANGGTLFLDDIGDLPLELQSQLLHVLEEREVLPRGAETPVKVDIRLVSAARGSLQEKIRRGEFRGRPVLPAAEPRPHAAPVARP